MHQRLSIAAFILGALIASATPAKADFLGLAPGDYTVTLNGSSSICGGTNCVGTVHIGASGDTDFDWLFENVGDPANDFDFSHFTHTLTTAPQDYACESIPGPAWSPGCTGPAALSSQFLELAYNTGAQATGYALKISNDPFISAVGNWSAVPVPEPLSSSLVLFGLSALGMWRWVKAKQD